MESNNLLITALIFVAVGFLVGILVMILFSDRGKRKDQDHPDSPVMENLIVPEMPVLPEERFESIAHLYREKHSGKLVTDVKGKVHLTRSTIPADQLNVLKEASQNWQAWLGAVPPALTPLPTVQPAAPTPVQPNIPAPVQPAPRIEQVPPAAGEIPARAVLPVDKPRARTMVGQIEEILQEMLPTSAYAEQNIHLTEEPGDGVIVWVGALKYSGIDSVPDEGVRELIKAAVRRWEESGGVI